MADTLHFLLVEPETLLRRTVAMTARSLNLGQVHEATDNDLALRLLQTRKFDGIVAAVDCVGNGGARRYDLDLIDRLREREQAGARPTPVAIMTAEASSDLLAALRDRRISRVILKPFRAKVLLETIAGFTPPRKA